MLQDIQNAAAEENMDVIMPGHLNRIDKVRGLTSTPQLLVESRVGVWHSHLQALAMHASRAQ